MQLRKHTTTSRKPAVILALSATLLTAIVGCSGGTTANNASAQYNTYAGTQSVSNSGSGGVWVEKFYDSSNLFIYTDASFFNSSATPPIGNTKASNGFLQLTLNGGSNGSGGYAVEIPGSGAMMRPGDNTNFPVVGAVSNSCVSQASATYQFITMAQPVGNTDPTGTTPPAYGSVQVDSSQGINWKFSSFNTYAFDGTDQNPAAIPAGACAYTQEGYVFATPTSQQTGPYPVVAATYPVVAAISSSGFFMLDLGQNVDSIDGSGPYGFVGVVEPSGQLDTGNIVAGKYIGFQFVPLENQLAFLSSGVNLGPTTAPVAFGQTAGSGTVMTGGVYPNDDVTQTAPSNITIDLGQQDSQNNGLYKSVTVTIPDTSGACLGQSYGGTDANGNPTCIFPGVAVVGDPNNKYALFITADDERAKTFGYFPNSIEFFLYQQ